MPIRHWSLLLLPLLIPGLLFAVTGPIAQPIDYHAFADQRALQLLPNAVDVVSNLAFVVAGLFGLWRLRRLPQAGDGRLFAVCLLLTGFGSAWYHLAPDNSSLVWDRLPMALAFAALISHTLARAFGSRLAERLRRPLFWLAPLTVLYWYLTEELGVGDLRPYLLLQLYPLLAITLWLLARRLSAGWWWVVGGYAAAKLAELGDAWLWQASGLIAGHGVKHLLAALAAGWALQLISLLPEARNGR